MDDLLSDVSSATQGFSGFDWVVVAVVLLSMVVGLWRGFAREVMAVLGWVLAFVGASLLAKPLANALTHVIDDPTLRYLAGWLLIFVAVLAIFGAVGAFFSKQMRQPGFNLGNRFLGGMFGVVRGLVIMMAAVLLLRAFLPDSEEAWLDNAQLVDPLDDMAEVFGQTFDDVLEADPPETLGESFESSEML
ncbi:CvpA family protein [Luminiphilus syltensis NOR5-1B]|uniref:CvpA family protein n=1 Tax=Luminiphilus syltensis NOR5-1B TaxID=565045 RepID=B8KYE1_9GAMM|nr:CvpA family protein [Luminiphilus syltensis]EED35289.1 CvpA family protein [Luminiphilus syltensis NOR5-1B]